MLLNKKAFKHYFSFYVNTKKKVVYHFVYGLVNIDQSMYNDKFALSSEVWNSDIFYIN